jgi:hypothetical protein
MHLIGDLYAKGYIKDYYRAENIEMSMLLDTGMIMLHDENGQGFFAMLLKSYDFSAETPLISRLKKQEFASM